ncbi:unnamed protein product [Lathyrus oleraceus]
MEFLVGGGAWFLVGCGIVFIQSPSSLLDLPRISSSNRYPLLDFSNQPQEHLYICIVEFDGVAIGTRIIIVFY